jgi:CopG family transcriptional regulator, nickel-responsive regulator
MPIVSLSLNDKILAEIDRLEKELGFSGRSEVVRAAIRHFITEDEGVKAISGKVHAIMIVTHSNRADEIISEATHKFDDIVITHLHNKTEGDKCLETFIVAGDAGRIKAMFKTLQSNRKADYVKILII